MPSLRMVPAFFTLPHSRRCQANEPHPIVNDTLLHAIPAVACLLHALLCIFLVPSSVGHLGLLWSF